jgi:hypothetical protein
MFGGQEADVLRGGCILEHQMIRFAIGLTFSWQVQYFREMGWNNHKTQWYEAVTCGLNFSIFEGSLAELHRF